MKVKYPYHRWTVWNDKTGREEIKQDDFYVTESELMDIISGSVMDSIRDGAGRVTVTKVADRPEEYI